MEIVVGVENNDEGKFEESVVETLSLPKFIADPVVYKLVRVHSPLIFNVLFISYVLYCCYLFLLLSFVLSTNCVISFLERAGKC